MGVPCKSPCLFVSTATHIIALDYNNDTAYPIISGLSRAVALDIHFNLSFIFWSDVTERNNKRANVDRTNITVLHKNTGVCDRLVVELHFLQLYWTDTTHVIQYSYHTLKATTNLFWFLQVSMSHEVLFLILTMGKSVAVTSCLMLPGCSTRSGEKRRKEKLYCSFDRRIRLTGLHPCCHPNQTT